LRNARIAHFGTNLFGAGVPNPRRGIGYRSFFQTNGWPFFHRGAASSVSGTSGIPTAAQSSGRPWLGTMTDIFVHFFFLLLLFSWLFSLSPFFCLFIPFCSFFLFSFFFHQILFAVFVRVSV